MATPTLSSLHGWRDHARAVQSQGQWQYDILWRPLAPFFETHGYFLWVRTASYTPTENALCHLGPPNSHPRAFDGYSYSSPYSLNNENTRQRKQSWQQMSPVICPARTAQNHDVMIRLVAVGSFGDKHSRALDRLGTPELTFLPQNHSLPILNRIVYENQYHFAVFPMMEDVQSLPDFFDFVEAVDYVEQLVEGLDFLHERSISHGDICKENILVNFVGPPLCTMNQPLRSRFPVRYYYTDLEFTTCSDEGESAPSAQGSPMSWSDRGGVYSRPSAPELSKPDLYSPFQADVWQLGHLLNEEFEDFPHFDGYQQLFKNMMKEDPRLRPSLNEVLTGVRRLKLDVHPIRGLPSDRSGMKWWSVLGLLGHVRGWWNVMVLAVLYNGFKAAKMEPRLLGTVENRLGISNWLKERGHEFVVTSDKEGPNSEFQKHLADAEVLITTPFHPGYLTRDLVQKAKNLKVCVTAGVGSDHIDLDAAVEHNIQVLEVSGSNVTSVAEHAVMSMLLLVRNFVPAHQMIERGEWNVSDIARGAFDLEGKTVGTLGAGRIGYRILQRLMPFDCKEHLYYDYNALPEDAAKAVKARRVEDLKEFVSQCDVVTINAPLHKGTQGLINDELLSHFKPGAWLVNTARGAICDKDAVARALKSGQLAGYAGDVWNVQPAPQDHVWRTMKNPLGGGNGMVPHYSGTTLDAQARYAEGTKKILENYFDSKPQEAQNIIVGLGKYETKAYGQR